MSITISIETNIVVNAAEKGDTFDDIIDFISDHIESWRRHQVLWDMTLFDFQSIDSHSIRSLVRKGIPLSKKRFGLKTAILVNSDLAFGMMQMLQLLAHEQVKVEIGVFRDKDQATKWLNT